MRCVIYFQPNPDTGATEVKEIQPRLLVWFLSGLVLGGEGML